MTVIIKTNAKETNKCEGARNLGCSNLFENETQLSLVFLFTLSIINSSLSYIHGQCKIIFFVKNIFPFNFDISIWHTRIYDVK